MSARLNDERSTIKLSVYTVRNQMQTLGKYENKHSIELAKASSAPNSQELQTNAKTRSMTRKSRGKQKKHQQA